MVREELIYRQAAGHSLRATAEVGSSFAQTPFTGPQVRHLNPTRSELAPLTIFESGVPGPPSSQCRPGERMFRAVSPSTA